MEEKFQIITQRNNIPRKYAQFCYNYLFMTIHKYLEVGNCSTQNQARVLPSLMHQANQYF